MSVEGDGDGKCTCGSCQIPPAKENQASLCCLMAAAIFLLLLITLVIFGCTHLISTFVCILGGGICFFGMLISIGLATDD